MSDARDCPPNPCNVCCIVGEGLLQDADDRIGALEAENAALRAAGDALAEAVEHEANVRTRSGRVVWQRGYDALAVWLAASSKGREGEVSDGSA